MGKGPLMPGYENMMKDNFDMANEANIRFLANYDKGNKKDKEEICESYEDLIKISFIRPLKSYLIKLKKKNV